MLDEKKIEEAAKLITEKYRYYTTLSNVDRDKVVKSSFSDGAHWAVQEFLKGLWHPASKIPKKGKPILCWMNTKYRPCFIYVYNDMECYDWNIVARLRGIEKWCYLNDLLPKQKGDEG